jgi:hypothetical protein
MAWKDIFIVTEGSEESAKTAVKKVAEKPATAKSADMFPSSDPVFPSSTPEFTSTNYKKPAEVNPFLDKILEVYEKGFDKLNQPGYDFFEFYKAVLKAGVNNPQVYVMALDMAQSMDGTVTRDSLLKQSEYYISELEKVYNEFNNNGRNKIQELTQKKTNETTALSQEIASLQQQLSQIQVQISLKQSALADIDSRYHPEIEDINLKLNANDFIKNKFVTNINLVKMNISNNLK